MTDLFAQEGITFNSASMASTHPSATPAPIEAPKIDMANAPANATPAGATPAAQESDDYLSQLTAPKQASQSLAGAGSDGAAPAGVAPPQPASNSVDLFQQEDIKPPAVSEINANAFSQGVTVPASDGDGKAPELTTANALSANRGIPPSTDAVAYTQNQQAQDKQLGQVMFTQQELDGFKNNPIGFTEAFSKVNRFGYALGDNDADALKILPLATKVQMGQQLSSDEQNTITQYLRDKLEMNLRGFTWAGKTAYVGAQIPSWAAQFALSGAIGKLAEAAAQEAAIVGAEQVAKSAAVRVATQYSTLMVPHYDAAYDEQQLNNITAVTNKGQMFLKDAENSPAKTAALAFGHASADIVAQMMAPAIGKYAVQPIKAALATPITAAASKLSPEVTTALYNAWKAVNPNATVSKMFTSMGWSGMVEQIGANRVQQVLNASVDFSGSKNETFDDYLTAMTPSKDQLLLEGGLVSIAGGIHASTALTVNLLRGKGVPAAQATDTAANMSSLERDAFVNKNLPLPKSEAPTLEQNAPTTILADRAKMQGPAAAKNIIAGATNAENATNQPPINEAQSGFNKIFPAAKVYAEMWNDLNPIEKLGDKAREAGAPIKGSELSPAALSLAKSTPALIERQWTTGTTSWDREGNQVVTGKGLKQIGDDYDNMFAKAEPDRDARQQDMNDFRKAMTFIEDKTKGYNPVSEKDFTEAQGNLSRLADKYGDQMKWMESFAKEYRDFDNRILHNLVTSGLKTQAWYDDLVGKREWYSSTARVTEAEYPDDVAAAMGKGLGKDVNPNNVGALKQRQGSEKEVIDPVQSSMRNSAIIIQRAMLNKVRGDVAKYAQYYPDKVKVKPPALIREAVEHSYDPKLRTKLEQIAEAMGGQVKRAAAGEKLPQLKGNLGAYEPATGKTYLKPGTTEGTLTHEIGHMLDYMYGLKDKMLKSKTMKTELEKLAEDRLRANVSLERTPEGKTEFAEKFELNPKKYIDYVKNDREILANFFDAWVNSPEKVERVAPVAKAMFEKFIDNNPDLAALKQIEPSTQRSTETIQKALLDFKGPKDSLPFYKNGKLLFLRMDSDIAEAFKGLDQVQGTLTGNFIAKIGKAQARMLQFGATNNPYFIVRHFLRGAQSSFVNTPLKEGAQGFFRHFAVEIPKGIAAVIGKNDAYREWAASSGALRTYMDTSTEGMAKLHAEMFDHMDYSKFLNPVNWAAIAKDGFVKGWTTAKQVSDYAPRIAAYERLKAKGYSDLEAGFLSLEATGNYIRHGSLGKAINAYSPFFNDRLQGADRFLRAVKRDPAGYSMRAIALITMPQLLISGYYLFAADDETRKEYLNLSDFRRSAAMNIKINGQWIPIPRPFAPGFAFGALPEFAMIHFSGVAHPELKNFWLHMIGGAVSALSPSTDWTQTIPPLLKSAIESQTNFSFYRDMPIFHGDKTKTAPENQFNSNTSETAKAAGKLFGISPANIDNTVYDMGAHIGVYGEQLGDYAINTQRRLSGQPVNEKPTKGSDNPLYGPLMQPAPIGTASESFQEFHEHEQDLSQQHNRDKELVGKDKATFEQENHQDIALYPTINRANTEVTHEEHEIRLVSENPNMTGDQKAQQIAQHQQRIEAIVEGANNIYRNAKGQK